jgi:hypothetical protein
MEYAGRIISKNASHRPSRISRPDRLAMTNKVNPTRAKTPATAQYQGFSPDKPTRVFPNELNPPPQLSYRDHR